MSIDILPDGKTENQHHMLWERGRWMGKTATKILREQPLLKVDLPIRLHDELHQNIAPIDPVCSTLAYDAINWIRQQKGHESLDEFIEQMQKLSRRSTSPRQSVQAGILADHLQIQSDFIIDAIDQKNTSLL